LFYAFGIGLVMGFIGLAPLGLHALALVLAILAADLFFENVITNRSLYSFALLGLVANLAYKSILYSFWAGLDRLGIPGTAISFGSDFWSLEARSLAVNILMMALVYQVLIILSKKYKPAFLSGLSPYG
jgi:hypothetical protein